MREYTAKEEGYVFMYVSNESATLVDVYFDDVVMTHTKGNVVQYNEYYPFGLPTTNSWTRENTTGNNFLGNGGTELNTTSNLYDLHYRNYDPTLGRMNQVDPMATKYASLTPYNFAFNDPVYNNDVSGADPNQDEDLKQAMKLHNLQRESVIRSDQFFSVFDNHSYMYGVIGDDALFPKYGPGNSTFFNSFEQTGILRSNMRSGISSILGSANEFGGNVNIGSRSISLFSTFKQAVKYGARYVQRHNAWSYVDGGKSNFLDRIRPEGTVVRGSIYVDKTIAADYDEAAAYLKTSKNGAALITFLEENAIGLEIWDLNIRNPIYVDSDNVLIWDPKYGFAMESGGYQSPSLALAHELLHSFQDILSVYSGYTLNESRWQNEFEEFATRNANPIARQLGQSRRASYSRTQSMYFENVNSFVPDFSRRARISENFHMLRNLNPFQLKILDSY